MKKLIFLILTLAYITSTSGATIYLHECMGKIIDWNLHANDDKCDKCGMHKNNAEDCCKDIVKVYKLQTAHSLPAFNFHLFSSALIPPAYFLQDVKIFYTASITLPDYVFPPPKASIGLCIFNCTFLV